MTISKHNDHRTTTRRPWRLLLLLILLAVIQGIAAVRALSLPADLAATVSLSRPLEIIAGAGWAAAFTGCAIRIWRNSFDSQRNPGTIPAVVVLFTLFAVYSIGRLALFARADYDRQRLPLLVFVVMMAAAVTAIVMIRGVYHRIRRKQG